jgi:predicted Zn-dependent protease
MHTIKLLIVPLLLAFATLTGCATDRQVIGQANNVHGQLKPAVMNDPELATYLQQVGDRIINTAKELDRQGYGPKSHKSEGSDWMFGKDMKFHFVNSKTLNAFTTGGEHMYIYTQLFEECQTEDELAAVMAHEYGHVYARHVAKGMDRQMTLMGLAVGAGAAGYAYGGKEHGAQYAALAAGATGGLGQFMVMGYTRKDEAEADKLGFDFYTRGGWDPNKFDDFFQHMIDKGLDATPAMASDHPTLKSRVEVAQKRVKELPPAAAQWRKPPIADTAKFRQLQQRAVAVGKTVPSDQTLANSQQLLKALPRSCIMPYDPPDEIEARQQIVRDAEKKEQKKK